MCGIYGLISENEQTVKEFEDQKKHFDAVLRRGTESFEYKFNKCFFSYTNFAVRNVFNPDDVMKDNIMVLLNGEIYNCPSGMTEFEYIRKVYICEGISGFKNFNGKFAILIYDLKKGALYMVRDVFGKIPMFYTIQDEALYFSSLASCLLPVLKDHSPDDVALFEMELFRYRSFDRTKYRNIRQLPPNTVLCFKAGKITKWPLKDELQSYDAGDKAPEDVLNELLIESVTSTLNNVEENRAIGILVSGIDSYILFKIIERYYNGRIIAFVFHSHREPFDFSYDPKKTTVEKIKLYTKDFFKNLEECVRLCRGIDSCPIKTYIFARKIKERYPELKVVYCGEGADELFGGYTENIRHADSRLAYVEDIEEYEVYGISRLLKDFSLLERNTKSITGFFLKHQLVEVHLNPFNICFQNFLLELRSPFLYEKILSFSKQLPGEYFIDKKIIKLLAQKEYDFDTTDYKKISLPASIGFY